MGYTNVVEQPDCDRLLKDIQMRRKTDHRITLRKLVMFCALLTLFGIIYFGYICSDNRCSLPYNPKPAIYPEWNVMNLLSTNMSGRYTIYTYIYFYFFPLLNFIDTMILF